MTGTPIVLFDLDDTLTDANGFAAGVLADAAGEHGYGLTAESVARHAGAPYVPLLQEQLRIDIETARAIYATYVAQYRLTMGTHLRERSGATAILHALTDRGAVLGLVTNKLETLACEILGQFGWSALFAAVAGQDSCPFRKPHPGIVHHALGVFGGRVARATFVGDSPGDMQCARDAGVPVIVGLLGTTSEAALVAAGATHVCADLDEVRTLLLPRIGGGG